MKITLKLDSVKIIFLLILYYGLLFFVYSTDISLRWSYRGFVNNFSFEQFILSLVGLVFTIIFYIIIDKKDKPSAMVMNLFNIVFFVPMYVFVAFTQVKISFYFFLLIYHTLLTFIYIFSLKIAFHKKLLRSKTIFYVIIGFILISNLLINGYYNGFRIKIDLSDVYENRLAVRGMSIPALVGYLRAFSYFTGIIALMYAMKIKNWILVASIIALQLMSFAFGASKTQFFSIFICLIAFKFYSEKFKFWAPVSLVLILMLSIIEYNIFNLSNITDIFTRRTLFVPSKISYNMYDFFETSGREFLYLRGSVLRIFGFTDPYANQEGFQRMIGFLYGGTKDTNANTGLLGNDYSQFGWLSLLIFPVLRIIVLRIYDYCALEIDKRITVVLSIFIAFVFISGAFFTVLVTNGILLTYLLLYFFPRDNLRI